MMDLRNIREKIRTTLAKRPRLTTRGRFLLAAGVSLLAVGVVSLKTVLIELALLDLFFLAFGVWLADLNLRGVRYVHRVPESAYKNQLFATELRVFNAKTNLPAFDIEVLDNVGTVPRPVMLPAVAPLSVERRTVVTRINRRGLFHDFPFEFSSRFPLGLATKRSNGVSPDTVVVYPRPVLPSDVRQLLEAGVGYGGLRNSLSSDFVGELKSFREYRTGDRPKRISWPFSVRLQKLIVKEVEEPCPRNVSVLFHSYQPPGVILSRRSFERALQLLSGIFHYLSSRHIPFDIAARFTDWKSVAVSPQAVLSHEVRTLLATAVMSPSRDLRELNEVIQRETRSSVVQLVVSNTPVRFWSHLLSPSHAPVFCMDNTDGGVARLSQRATRT